MLNILFIGDIVGSLGREAVKKLLPKIKKEYNPDLTIANGENLAHGKGVTETTLKEMLETGIDYFTGGNHIFARKNFADILNNEDFKILRPANYPRQVPGRGEKVINISQKKLLLVNLIGRIFMKEDYECPFKKFDEIIKKYKNKIDAVIVDFHAEATSEKRAFGFYADGRAVAVIGTHTHIQTADEQILAKGCAYITDAGAVSAKESVLGVDKGIVIKSFLDQINYQHEIPRVGECEFNAVVVNIDEKNNQSKKIKRIQKITKVK